MGAFPDYLASVGANEDGSIAYPEDFMGGAQSAYDADIQGASATIALKDAEIAELRAQNTQLAAANWNLLQSIPTTAAVDDTDAESDEDTTDEESDEDSDPDTDDFFKSKD